MTQEELIKEIKQLPVKERIAVMDAISESVKADTSVDISDKNLKARGSGGDIQSKKMRMSIVDQLYGIAKPDGPPPSDAELKEDYIRYLTEKYS